MDQADGQSVKLLNRIVVSSWMGDPMATSCQAHGSWICFFFGFFLYTKFTSDVSQDSGSKVLCFHGNVQYVNRISMFLNY